MAHSNGKTNNKSEAKLNLIQANGSENGHSANGEASFPASQKVYIEGRDDVRVPMREISLSGGEPPLRVYDTSGPEGEDVHMGLPKLRDAWISSRGAYDETEPSYVPVPGHSDPDIPMPPAQKSAQGPGQRDPDALCEKRRKLRPRWNSSPSARI